MVIKRFLAQTAQRQTVALLIYRVFLNTAGLLAARQTKLLHSDGQHHGKTNCTAAATANGNLCTSVYLMIHVFAYFCINLLMYLFTLFTYLCIYLCSYLIIYLSTYLFTHVFTYLFTYVSI
jgi:hypothetical protein